MQRISILIGILICLSCINEKIYTPEYNGSKIVLNAQWYTCDTIHLAYLARSYQYNVGDVEDDLVISCRVNSHLEQIADTSWVCNNGKTFLSRCFQFHVALKAGDTVTLAVKSDSCDIKATAIVPPAPKISIDTVSYHDDYAGIDIKVYDVTLNIIDQEDKQDYYQAFSLETRTCAYHSKDDSMPRVTYYKKKGIDESDPVFKNIPLQLPSDFVANIGVFSSMFNTAHVFSDELFNGTRYSFYYPQVSPVVYFDSEYTMMVTEHIVRVASIPWDTYLYCLASNAFLSSTGDPFSEPVFIPDNVAGGLGNFGVYSVSEERINGGVNYYWY